MYRISVIFTWLSRKLNFNYRYFGLFFILLLSINLVGVFTVEKGIYWVKGFFILYNIGQVTIEFIGIVLLSIFLKRYTCKLLYQCYIGLVFVFLLVQFIEATLIKIMDISLKEGLHIAFGADMKNFIELLRLTDIGMGTWLGLLILTIILPFFGVFLYRLMEKTSARDKVSLHLGSVLVILCVIPMVLSLTDSCVFKNLSYREYSAYRKVLPWKNTFFKIPIQNIALAAPLKPPRNDSLILSSLASYNAHVTSKPNIYLFVVESLRSDYLDEETAPHLMTFKKDHISPEISLANANHTITSWFSIFHSAYPFYWAYSKNKDFQEGSLPLHILKKIGYNIHVYSSAQLQYYDFDQTLLGKNRSLANTLKLAPHYGSISSSDSDTEIMNTFQRDIKTHSKEGNVYIFFLDSTHFNYSWPKNFPQKFNPAPEVTWKHRLSNDLNTLKNRYKNSINFVDHLFGQTIATLKKLNLYEESVIVFCGDHGEEFKEEGKLFHASHLSKMQIHIPIYYKLGEKKQKVEISSHVDIFPTIIDHIDPNNKFLAHLDGSSIISAHKPFFAVVARYNSCDHPYEFALYQNEQSLLLKFNHKNRIFASTSLKVLDTYSQGVFLSEQEVLHQFHHSFESLFPISSLKHVD